MEKGILYVVATPIGNLKDITLRAIEVLTKVAYIACEDTRKTSLVLKTIGAVQKPMLISYYEETERARTPNIINLLQNGQDVALVSDSGTPLVSDPGFVLVRAAKENDIKVISIPGPSAAISALVSSGLPSDKFIFLGFLPRKEGNKTKLLDSLKESYKEIEATVIIYEAPHRLLKTLRSIEAIFGDINICIARELTKVHEETFSTRIKKAINHYEKKQPKGELVILFNLKKEFQLNAELEA
jgi:16S rRNA (cytidine1402-2'-O)-methyltransferase